MCRLSKPPNQPAPLTTATVWLLHWPSSTRYGGLSSWQLFLLVFPIHQCPNLVEAHRNQIQTQYIWCESKELDHRRPALQGTTLYLQLLALSRVSLFVFAAVCSFGSQSCCKPSQRGRLTTVYYITFSSVPEGTISILNLKVLQRARQSASSAWLWIVCTLILVSTIGIGRNAQIYRAVSLSCWL